MAGAVSSAKAWNDNPQGIGAFCYFCEIILCVIPANVDNNHAAESCNSKQNG